MSEPAEPLWLTLDDVEDIIAGLSAKYPQHNIVVGLGGKDKILSALDRPLNTWQYENDDNLINLAALYVHGLGKAHALMDGNKRLAFLGASVFLTRNYVRLVEPEDGFFGRVVIDLMADEISLEEFQAALAHNAAEV